MVPVLLTCATTGLSLSAVWWLTDATPRGQPWTPAVTRLHGRDGLSARRMAVFCTFRTPSLCRHVHRELMHNTLLNLTLIVPATAYRQRSCVETYSRYTEAAIILKRLDTGQDLSDLAQELFEKWVEGHK
jgi:hypothetical protein